MNKPTQSDIIVEFFKNERAKIVGDKSRFYDLIEHKLKMPRPTIRRALNAYLKKESELTLK